MIFFLKIPLFSSDLFCLIFLKERDWLALFLYSEI